VLFTIWAANDHHVLKGQIEQLKTSLDDAQLLRRRKLEYDQVAEKINNFPSRDELQQYVLIDVLVFSIQTSNRSIDALENDIAAIRSEHENQHRVMQSQKSALDGIISDIGSLRSMGKDTDVSRAVTPSPDGQVDSGDGEDKSSHDIILSSHLSASAKPFVPPSRISTPIPSVAQRQVQHKLSSSPLVSSPALVADKSQIEDDDIEMGELAEEPREKKIKKKERADLEEGEASDSSSELSDLPDDA
jgi:THO complex subunit 7